MASAYNTAALAANPQSNVIKLPNAGQRKIYQHHTEGARVARLALLATQKVRFAPAYPSFRLKDKRMDFMGNSEDAGYAARLYVAANLDGLPANEVAAIRTAAEGGDMNGLSDLALQIVLYVRRMTADEQSRLWPLFPRGGAPT